MVTVVKKILKKLPGFKQMSARWNFLLKKIDKISVKLDAFDASVETTKEKQDANQLAYNTSISQLRAEIKTDHFEKMKHIAISGIGSDECLENGFLPVPIHFYQPIPDTKELEERKVWDKKSKMSGIKIDDKALLQNLKTLSKWADECIWNLDPTDDKSKFHINNTCFCYGCASALHSIIREYKPKRIIEVGSGNSSKIIRDAIKLNSSEGYHCQNYSIIDPYSVINLQEGGYPSCTEVIKMQVELMDVDFFKSLNENDILFIDSSHVCKTGSDVNFEILEVLPILNKGVFIHFHDISLPDEYPKVLFTNYKFRMFWTEQYLLQAFLAYNSDFEVFFPLSIIQTKYAIEHRKLFYHGAKVSFWGSGSFWIKRIH